jgi:hypothetical protein
MGYDHLPVGIYDTREELHSDDPEFAELLHEYQTAVRRYDEEDDDFNNAYGILDISQNQADLKRIYWEIHWLSADGQEDIFKRTFFLHQDSLYWEQYGQRDFSFIGKSSEEEQ